LSLQIAAKDIYDQEAIDSLHCCTVNRYQGWYTDGMILTPNTSTSIPRRILIIDDEESIRSLLDEFLVIEGFDVKTAASGFEGLKALKDEEFGLIICDVSMPGMDGFQVFESVLKINPSQKFLFITGYNFEGSNKNLQGKSLGLLRKPFHLTDLQYFISRVFPTMEKV
jgi:DNA-binding NtrC family response regulator